MLVAGPTALGSGVEPSGVTEESGGTGEVQAYLGEVELEGLTCYWETEYRGGMWINMSRCGITLLCTRMHLSSVCVFVFSAGFVLGFP